MACRVWFHTHLHTQRPLALPGSRVSPSRSAICGLTSGPNPPTRGTEEEGLGRDSALCECKQKSASTMNNKSIQRKKKESLFRGQTAASQQLLAERGLTRLPRGYRATPQAAPMSSSKPTQWAGIQPLWRKHGFQWDYKSNMHLIIIFILLTWTTFIC